MRKLSTLVLCLGLVNAQACALSTKKSFTASAPSVGVNRPQNQNSRPRGAPTTISGLVFYLNSSYGVFSDTALTSRVGTDGATVGGWQDFSNSKAHSTQSSASLQPLYKKNIFNGKPSIRFDGSDDMMLCPVVLNGAKTIIVVGKAIALPSNVQSFTMISIKHTTPTFTEIAFANVHALYKSFPVLNDFQASQDANCAAVVQNTNPRTYWMRWAGSGDPTIGLDNAESAAPVCVGASFSQSASNLGSIGGRATAATTSTLNINFDYAEVMVYNRQLSLAELNLIGKYIEQTYGISWGAGL